MKTIENDFILIPFKILWNKQNFKLQINQEIYSNIILEYFQDKFYKNRLDIYQKKKEDSDYISICIWDKNWYCVLDLNKTDNYFNIRVWWYWFNMKVWDFEVQDWDLKLFWKKLIKDQIEFIYAEIKKNWLYNYNQKNFYLQLKKVNEFTKKIKNLIIN